MSPEAAAGVLAAFRGGAGVDGGLGHGKGGFL